MAAALTITERTAAAHVEHILRKLDMTSRAQIAAWVGSGLAGSSADLPMTHSAAPD
jgi:non-specific serine/threonine protein kinase